MINFISSGRASTVSSRLYRAGLIVAVGIAILIFLLQIFSVQKPVFNDPYLALALLLFVFGISIGVALLSANSFLHSGEFNVLLIGCAILLSGIAYILSVPSLPPELSVNEAATIYGIGILLSSFFLFLSSILTWTGIGSSIRDNLKAITVTTFACFLLLVAIVSTLSAFDLLPIFVTESGPTLLSSAVLGVSTIFYFLGFSIFGLMYLRTKSLILYWFSLALGLFTLATLADFFTISTGDPIDWVSRVAQFISGVFLLIALSTQELPIREEEGLSEKWARAFKGGQTQITTFFSEMLNGFSYNRVVVESDKPVDYVFLEVNDAFEKMTGLKAKKIIGKRATEVFVNMKSDVANWVELYGRVALKGESVKFESYSKPLGKWFIISAYSPEKGYFVALLEDITERKKAEEELDKYQKHLEKLVDEKTKQLMDAERLAAIGETAGMVGHDLRNPLQSIVGELYLAEDELKSVTDGDSKRNLQENIQTIEEQVGYMDKIVSDLQTFVSPVEAKKQSVNLQELVLTLLQQIDIPNNVHTTVHVKKALTVNADPQLLKRVLINLITNAVQAMPNGGKITITAQAANAEQVEISVADTGIGIPEDVKPKLFTPLFTTKSRGQGFGLAVCKRVIEAQGGTISFESEVGKGTKFIIHLPANKE